MSWTDVREFLAMGGYAFYVWGAYLVTAFCMAVEPLAIVLRHRRARQGLSTLGQNR